MQCPRCWKPISALATRCNECTTEFTQGHVWAVNIVGILIALAFIGLLLKLVF